MYYHNKITDYVSKEVVILKGLDVPTINKVINILNDCLEKQKKVYVFGNGGSGSTASHMANDFNKTLFNATDNVFNFICLNDNLPTVLAVANDEGYDEIFRYQLIGRLTKDDVIIALSGSGNSKNIINAVEYAKEVGALVIGFTGYDGGKLKQLADISIDTNVDNMQITEDVHLMLEHMIISIFMDTYGIKKYKKRTKKARKKKQQEKKERNRRLIEFAEGVSLRFREGLTGSVQRVLAEEKDETLPDGTAVWKGHASNYTMVYFPSDVDMEGKFAAIMVERPWKDGVFGRKEERNG